MMGIDPDGTQNRIATLSGLAHLAWVALEHVQAFDGHISIEHFGHDISVFTNECAHDVIWRARLCGEGVVKVNGKICEATPETMLFSEKTVRYVDVSVAPGETAQVEAVT